MVTKKISKTQLGLRYQTDLIRGISLCIQVELKLYLERVMAETFKFFNRFFSPLFEIGFLF